MRRQMKRTKRASKSSRNKKTRKKTRIKILTIIPSKNNKLKQRVNM